MSTTRRVRNPTGVWFNPKGLFGLADGGKVDSSDFHRLYNGFAPNTGGKLTQNAGSERRSAGLDLTFSADKSVSALWAVADPDLRSEIERAHNDAARVALEETVLRHLRLYPHPQPGRRDRGAAGRNIRRDVPAWNQPG